MKIVRMALAITVATTFAANSFAENGLSQPQSVTINSANYENYYDNNGPSASDSKTVPVAVSGAPDCGCNSCDSCGCGSSFFGNCCLGDVWEMYPKSCCGHKIGGWLQAGIYSNEHGANNNGPLGFNDVADEFDLHQAWLYAEKKAEASCCGWDWGYRFDLVYGTDGQDTQSFGNQGQRGWDNDWDNGKYGTAIPQAYIELAYGENLSIIAGHFYTNIGYEVVQATGNFFYSHSYAQYYAEPFTHSGFLATYKMNECTEVYGGYVTGWDTGFDDADGAATFLGGIKRQLSDDASIAWIFNAGDWGSNGGNIYMNSIVFEKQLTCNLKYVLQHDLGIQCADGPTSDPNRGVDAEWYGINQYLLYTINDCWGAGLRFEWFRDDDGARVVAGNAGHYYQVTGGLNYKPHANVIIRPELRYDRYDGTVGGGNPFNNSTENEQFSGGLDFIFTF